MRKQRPSQPISTEAQTQEREQERKMRHPRLAAKRQAAQSQRRPPRRRSSLGAGMAVVAGRAAGALSRRLHLGGGTSIVGVVAQRVYPDIVGHLASQLEYGSVLVTGTNGKTTTSSFIAAILHDAGLRVWRNREGSNLVRGVASSLVIRALPNGRLRRAGRAISIFEIDEATLPQITPVVSPRVAVFTNLFRDQLDRYGEVDSVVARWQQAISNLPASTTLVLNADDPATAHLGESFAGKALYYGIDDLSLDLLAQHEGTGRHQTLDTRTCPQCGTDYTYDVHFYSHMGHYQCPKCGLKRPQPDVRAIHVQPDSFDRLRIQVAAGMQEREIVIPLPGFYNIYNALAALTAALALNVDWEPIITGIEQSKPVFGRGERIQAEGRTLRLLLAKNPTGFNEVLRTLFSDGIPRHVLFVLNDNIADGQDISWIWDVDFERVVGQTKTLVVSGTRALDLALRLKYAGVAPEDLTLIPPAPLRALRQEALRKGRTRRSRGKGRETVATQEQAADPAGARAYGLKNALALALGQTPVGETLFVVPTYTGLLAIHHELEQRGLTPHYWEGRDV
jgi:UDP-N-acetylmuramyl tripeptide synthase